MTGRLRLAPFPSHAVAVHELLRNSTEAGLELDMNGLIRAASPAVAGLLGWRASDLTGHDLRQFVFAEDVEILNELLAHPGPSAPTVELRVMRHRRSRPVSLEISVVRTPTAIRVHLQDVLSWRVVELALRGQSRLGTAIADGTPTMLLRLDQQCRCEHANAAWSEATGTRLPDEPGLSWLRSLDEGTLVAFRDALPALCLGTSFQHEALVRHLDGYVSRYSIAVAPIVDEHRAFSGFLFVGSDQGALNAEELTLIAATAKFAPLDYTAAAEAAQVSTVSLPQVAPEVAASTPRQMGSRPMFAKLGPANFGPTIAGPVTPPVVAVNEAPTQPVSVPLFPVAPAATTADKVPSALLKANLESQRGAPRTNQPATISTPGDLFMVDDEPAPWPIEIPSADGPASVVSEQAQRQTSEQETDNQYRRVQPVSVEPDPITRLALASVLAAARASTTSFELMESAPDVPSTSSEPSPTDRAAVLLNDTLNDAAPDAPAHVAADVPTEVPTTESSSTESSSTESSSTESSSTVTPAANEAAATSPGTLHETDQPTHDEANDRRNGQVFISDSAKEQLIGHLDGLHLDGMGGVVSVALIFIDVLATGSEGLEDRRYDLKILERRLRTAVREHEYAAPLLDQGFVVAARGSFGSGDLEALVLRLMGRLSAPLRGHSHNGSPKLCVAAVRSGQGEVDHDLIARAERARAQAIGTGPGSIVLN